MATEKTNDEKIADLENVSASGTKKVEYSPDGSKAVTYKSESELAMARELFRRKKSGFFLYSCNPKFDKGL